MSKYKIYKHLNKEDECIYVGLTTNMKGRQSSHRQSAHWDEVHTILEADTKNKTAMILYEQYYINKLQPKYNKKDKRGDDVSFLLGLEELEFKEYWKRPRKQQRIVATTDFKISPTVDDKLSNNLLLLFECLSKKPFIRNNSIKYYTYAREQIDFYHISAKDYKTFLENMDWHVIGIRDLFGYGRQGPGSYSDDTDWCWGSRLSISLTEICETALEFNLVKTQKVLEATFLNLPNEANQPQSHKFLWENRRDGFIWQPLNAFHVMAEKQSD